MKKLYILFLLLLSFATSMMAQRKTDPLDRGLVAIAKKSGVFCSWRILPEEYYGVKYNLYRNGTKVNSTPLSVSNYTDESGTASSTYTVKAVVNGVEQTASKSVSPWNTGRIDTSNKVLFPAPAYLYIRMQDVVDRNGDVVFCCCGNHTPAATVAQNYALNDCSAADIDGDGEMEIIVKRMNLSDAISTDAYAHNGEIYSTTNTRAFDIIEAYKLNGTRLWWIDCGPNMVSMNSVEINAVAYDWDEDGKAEVIMRGADNMIIHKADGTTYNVGDMSINTRNQLNSHTDAQYAWTKTGNEYLLYLNGSTANPYSVSDYPLKRLESGETLASAWAEGNSGKAYGHRSSKYFFGAPVLDGRKASIFLGRGIYTQTKMIALDVDPASHALTTRWSWKCNTKGSSWYGQGNHNFSVADVDGDGCDEIIYGSMVIDNNGKGLSTTGLGHGDALHVGDLDPFRKGLEVFACNEEKPANNFRNATTSEIYYRTQASGDDGRAMAGNFSNDYPGCIAASVKSGIISTAHDTEISDLANNCFGKPWNPMSLNGRIYWDGDLQEETLDSPGTEGEATVSKLGTRIMQTGGCKLNNDSKNNPCFQGDIIGDWREELILRSWDNQELRIYSTTDATSFRIPSLWFDPEYRQAMVWQPCGYNQPPHVSFFMGEMEGLTKVPVPLTMAGRTEVANGANITSSHSGKDVLLYGAGNYGLEGDNALRSLIVDVPSTVSGNGDNGNITYSYSQAQLGVGSYKGNLTGDMNFVKQGDGLLKLTNRTFAYTGATDIFAGSLYFRGTFSGSDVWMNRHTTFYSGATIDKSLTMEYGSKMYIVNNQSKADGSTPDAEYSSTTINTLNIHEGARVVFDMNGSETDKLNVTNLSVRKRNWTYGPKYLAPVFQFYSATPIVTGKYCIGEVKNIEGGIENILIEGNFAENTKGELLLVDGKLYLNVYSRMNMTYIGTEDNSTGFWTSFSDSYLISDGYTYNFKFKNFGGKDNWNNWNIACVNGTGHSTGDRSDYKEYFVLRADQYGWGDYYNTPTLRMNGSDIDWTSFRNDMASGSDVDMNVTFSNSVLKIDATITGTSGNTYTYIFTSKTISVNDVTVFFLVDNSHMTFPTRKIEPATSVKMTYVDMNDPTVAKGEVETARSGYNKISGGKVEFAYSNWGVNHIAYLQVDLSAYKNMDVTGVNLSFEGSGSTDSKRGTGWGIGYNNSEWTDAMTYNTADRSITTVGDVQYTTTKSASIFETFTWDITDVYKNDNDGVITILIYETAAAGGYIRNPKVEVNYNGGITDLNGDLKLTISDAAALISFLGGNVPAYFDRKAADFNDDKSINLDDLKILLEKLSK